MSGDLPRRLLIWTVIPTHHHSSFIDALRKRGFDVVVYYSARVSDDRLKLGWGAFESLPAGEHYVPKNLSAIKLCHDWRERIHILPGYIDPFFIGIALILSVRGIPWVHWSEPSRPYNRTLRGTIARKVYGAMVNYLALGAFAIGDMARKDFIKWGVASNKIFYLPYTLSALKADTMPSKRDLSVTRFLFVGALCHRKAIDVLLTAFSILFRRRSTVRLELVGDDQENGRYQALCADLKLDNVVTFSPPVAACSIGNVIQNSDVLILPSRFDGWGVVINEAISLGKPIIATNMCGAAHHLVVDQYNGFVIEPEQSDQLATCMQVYCDHPNLIITHGEASRCLFEEVTPERNAIRMEEALNQMCS